MGEFVRLEKKGYIAVVTMQRAPLNVANGQFYQEIIEVFDEISADKNFRVSILCSKYERYWCVGNDIKDFEDMTPDNGHIRHRLLYNSFMAVYDCAVPVIAAIDGYCLGSGLAFASVCDIVFATNRSILGAPEITVGVMGTGKFLSRMVPQFVMRRMIYNGENFPASELEKWGCLQVFSPEKLMGAAIEQACSIADKCPSTMRLSKEALNRIEFEDLKTGYAIEQEYSRRASAYKDSKEAQKAFFEKRTPVFKGE